MTTATAKSTLGNIFALIGTSAGALTKTVETGIETIDMLDRFVKKQSEKQLIHDTNEMAAYELDLLDEMSLERSRRQNEVRKFKAESVENAASYDANYAFFKAVTDEAKAARKQARG